MSTRWAAWPRGIRWLIGGIAAVILVLAIAWVLVVPAADWLAHHDVGSVKGQPLQAARDAARGRLLTLGAGLLAAGALTFTALNFNLLRRNSEQADQWQRRTHELTEQGQVTDRYTKAIEQLGSGALDVRIGGIYALERIGRDSARDRPTVIEVLAAFIREHSREQWPIPKSGAASAPERTTRPDVQAALTVIGRRGATHDRQRVDLKGAELYGVDLADARLTDTDLTGADLTSAYLTAADLFGANLTAANLRDANLCDSNLNAANLRDANLCDANLTGAHLTETLLTGADLTSAKLTGADLNGANLNGANLTGVDLFVANLTGANLSDANLTGANLRSANLTGANLTFARWPQDSAVPDGWQRDPEPDQLKRADTTSGTATVD